MASSPVSSPILSHNVTRRKVLVSGATGFIGGHLVLNLRQAGFLVSTIGRRSAQLPREVEQFIYPDLSNTGAIRPAFESVDWVVHLAGLAHVTRGTGRDPFAEYRQSNVDITRAFVHAAVDAGASAFVLLSTVAALEKESANAKADARRRAGYSRSKKEAEGILMESLPGRDLRPIVIRAPMVYGPNMKGNPLRLFRLIERGVPLPLGAIRNRRSSLYVGNLVAAIRYSLENATVRGIIHVADTEILSTPDFIRLSAKSLGVKPRLLSLPPAILNMIGKLGDWANRITRFPLTTEAVERLTESVVLDTRPPHSLPGFQLPFSAEEGIDATGRSFREERGLRVTG